MNLYRLSQNINRGYDTFDSAIVAAENELLARYVHPGAPLMEWDRNIRGTWVSLDDLEEIDVELIGAAAPGIEYGVVLASYNAG